jgi:branched-chain amino acid aminotransferase
MSAIVYVNGRISTDRDAVVSVLDHGFLYGEGVYEVLRTYRRQPFLFDAHMRRLRDSAAMISLEVPFTDAALLAGIRGTMAVEGGNGESYIRLLVTRGVGDLSYDPAACGDPTLVIIVKPLEDSPVEVYERGVSVALVSVTRNHPRSVNPRIKSNNLLNNALATQEALRQGAYEALMLNYRGELCECALSNFFLVRDGVALTPPLEAGILGGITRAFIFELGRQTGLPVREAVLHEADLTTAEEAFLTSTTREIVPIVRIGDQIIGSGAPGAITTRLLDAFRKKADAMARALVST